MNLKPDSVLIGFDYGTKKMGVAIAQCITKTATPLNVLKIKNEKPNWEQLDQIVSDYRPVLAIIGYPGKINKQTSLLADKIEKFGSAIEKHYKMPTILFDETYSTTIARKELRDLRRDGNLSRRIKRGQVDSMAAKIILEQWLKLKTLG
ncbi:MAG: Holliday junction resolvase RuvX [Gammaproteobacteria bacterium]|nr:Holliday junction resolvase RuvX [Gammaproteobacteria bacterium]|tara:strand:+ start:7139 stop:7585 length:447 start_codon:yes stop_codon:yes gene_type:complete